MSRPLAHLVLLASPLLGPAEWAPVASLLRDRGRLVTVAPSPRAVRTPQEVLDAWLGGLPDGELVLVPHSNAGLYVAALAAVVDVEAVVYVDAGLPSPAPTTPTCPAWLRDRLAGLVGDDGLLPPWTEWWPEEDMARQLADPASRRAVEREQRRLPLCYFEALVPSPAGWETLRSAYLSFGDTYEEERTQGERRGWPVVTLPGGHLHMQVDPVAVADAVLRLEAAVRTGG